MTHIRKQQDFLSFSVQTAIEYSLDEAVMIQNLKYWIEKNIGNKKHNYDGRTWTYNTLEAFAYLFPFWSKKQVWRVLNSLEKKGVIIKGNYNQHAYDRTQWYAFKDEEKWIRSFDDTPPTLEDVQIPKREQANSQTGTGKFPNGNRQIPKREQANSQTGTTIPNNYQTTTNNNNNDNARENNQAIPVHAVLSSLKFEESTEPHKTPVGEEKAERQKEEVAIAALSPLAGLSEKQIKTASRKIAALAPDQAHLVVLLFNKMAESGRIKENANGLLESFIAQGRNNELEPPRASFNANPTVTPTQAINTPVAADTRKKTVIETLKVKVSKYKAEMLEDFHKNRSIYIKGLGVMYKEELEAAGLFE